MRLFKRKQDFKVNKETLFNEVSTAKTAADMWNLINRLPNPDVILKAAGKDISVLRIVKSNYQVSANITSRKAGITGKKWRLKPNDCPDKKMEFFEEIFKKLDVYNLISQILEAPLFGYVPIELYWENDGKTIIPYKTIAKPQEWFHFDSENNFYFRSKENRKGELIEESNCKFLIVQHHPDYLNPYGEALLAKCYWYTLFMKYGIEFWFKFMEKYGMPFLVGKYDKSLDREGQKTLFEGLVNLIQDAVGIIPNDGAVDVIENNAGGSDNYDKFITRCENICSKIILGQTLTTDIGSTGSYAASKTHQEVRQDIIDSDKRLVEQEFKKLILMINKINFNDDLIPEFEIYEDEEITTVLADRDNKVKSLGVKFKKDYVCRAYGYSEDDIEMEENTDIEFSQAKNDVYLEIPEIQKNLISEGVNGFSSLDEQITPPVVKELKKIVDFYSNSFDSEATEDKLAELYPNLSTDELEEILTKIIFAASLLGGVKDE